MSARFLRIFYRMSREISRFSAKAATRLEWLLISRELAAIPDLYEIYRTMRRSPEAGWTVGEDDVLRLYRLVLGRQPRHILEFGTGIGLSTAAMALALTHAGPASPAGGRGGRITTLEQNARCIEIARSLIPADLAGLIEFVHADAKIFQIPEISNWQWFCGYAWNPPAGAVYDFVLIDGPSGWVEGDELISLDHGDVFRLLRHMAPGATIYVDGRRQTAKKLKRYLSRHLALVEQGSEYAIFRRNAEPLPPAAGSIITDAKLEAAGKRGPYVISSRKKA
ncbi:MAG: hypothetical protein AAB844_00360 [Patescibacteria group bacterium]